MARLKNNGIKNFKSNIKGMGSFIIQYNNSVNVEHAGVYGISHLIEHCMCNQLKQYELEFEKYGINYNASTGFTHVEFFISGLNDGIEKFRNIFYDLIVNYEIPEDVFERERNIVIQEYNDNLGSPYRVFCENIFRKYFGIRCSIGEMEDLKNLTYEMFIKHKKQYFNLPTYICNTSSSKIKKDEFKTEKNGKLNKDVTGYSFKDTLSIPNVNGTVAETTRFISYISKFNYNVDSFEEYAYFDLLSSYLCYGLSSPLYKELREETGHVYVIQSFVDSVLKQGNAAFFIILKSDPTFENEIKDKLLQCLKNHLNNIDKNTYENVLLGYKNSLKRNKLMSFVNNISFNSNYCKKIEKFDFNFEKFKLYAKKLYENDYILINDINY